MEPKPETLPSAPTPEGKHIDTEKLHFSEDGYVTQCPID